MRMPKKFAFIVRSLEKSLPGAPVFIALLLLAMTVAPPRAEAQAAYPRCDLSISFDMESHRLMGRATITVPEGSKSAVHLGGLDVKAVRLNGETLDTGDRDVSFIGVLEVSYEAVYREAAQVDLENVGVVYGDVIGEEGISLTGGWYPRVMGLAYFSLRALVPEGFRAISEAEEIVVTETQRGAEHTFDFPHPVDGINFVAAKYDVLRDTVDGVEVYAYFFHEDVSLAETYIEHAKEYLKTYSDMLTPYPFKRFSVVENFLPTGYSMPTFTLLGQTVVRLPFIVKTSLGHEVLHQWFGNYVYADFGRGNWLEGITSYLADHYYDELLGAGPEHRKKLLVDYQGYVHEDNEIALSDFRQRADFATRAVGYGKGAMVFHALRSRAGDKAFYEALRTLIRENGFRRASWDDIRGAFEKTLKENLEWFFGQWVDRKGLPEIIVRDARVLVIEGTPTVLLSIAQQGDAYRLSLPITVYTVSGQAQMTFPLEKKKAQVRIEVDGTPLAAVIDENHDLPRRLSEEERPPVISGLVGAEKRMLVVPPEASETYGGMVELFKSEEFKVVEEGKVKDGDIAASSVLVLGRRSPVLDRLFAGTFWEPAGGEPGEGFTILLRKNPLNPEQIVAAVYASSREEADMAAHKIFRYGKYSRLAFRQGRNVLKETAESERGIRIALERPVVGIRPESAVSLDDIVEQIIDVPVIFVGEGHTLYEDHKVQLKVIQSLREQGKKFAIGMEMFQRPYQSSLDDYIAGRTTEKEFLKSSEYFKRWQFNYFLYREIIQYARAYDIPIVALNQEGEIVRKVARGGLEALDEEELEKLPESMDMADAGYKRRLREVFFEHAPSGERTFENFYQAQILWDETMAMSIEQFLKENPGHQMVVIAGSGHVAYGSGIPKRLYRRTGREYVTLLNAKAGTPIAGLADYVLFPEPVEALEPPVLGVTLDKDKEGRFRITGFAKGSAAEEAGLRKGDRIILLDGQGIGSIEDIRIALLDKRGDSMKVRVIRDRRFLPDKEMEFDIEFPNGGLATPAPLEEPSREPDQGTGPN